MVTTPHSISEAPAVEAARTESRATGLGPRFLAYLIDSAILLGFILSFFALAGLILLLSSDLGDSDASDEAYYAFMGVFIGGTTVAWSVFNLALSLWRQQSTGQYLIGLAVRPEPGSTITSRRSLLRWFALHPLLYHPLLIPIWALFAAIAVSLTLSQLVLALTLGLVALCIVAPVVSLVAVLTDRDGRALHDRIAGTVVIAIADNRAR
jgi:uncharacterized RDD family membrane protein YckC